MFVIQNQTQQIQVWERASGKITPVRLAAGHYPAEGSELRWTEDGKSLLFAVRTEAWKAKARKRFEELTRGPIVVLDGNDDFLEWDAMNRMALERAIVAWDLATGTTRPLRAEGRIGPWVISRDGTTLTVQEDITRKTDYDVIGGREYKLVSQAVGGGEPRILFPSLKGISLQWAEDGSRYVATREGKVYLGTVADTMRRQLLGSTGSAAPDTSAAGRAARAKERFSAVRWSPAGDAILASNTEGFWVVDVTSGDKQLVANLPDSTSLAPRPQLVAWSQDGRYLYFGENSRTQWDRAIIRYDRQTRSRTALQQGNRYFTGLRLSRNGETAVLTISDGNRPGDPYVAGPDLANPRRVLEVNPQLAGKAVARTGLLSYLDADGKTRYGVLHYPAGYVKGTRYPTVFIVYENFFDDTWDGVANLLAAHGYAVVKPSVGFETGYPGEAWLKGVTAAANAVIQMGVADSARLGVHGTSYGGYATNLLITQTDRFKAAINLSGKVDIISFYTDSPRLGVRNIHAAEKSQDRIGATLWQQPQKYVQHSAVMFADRIKTPLLLMTGGQDHNVPELNTREMYYALRRLGKTVVWASYVNAGHGTPSTTEAEFVDYHQRILGWYDKYLKEKPKSTSVTSEGGR
jgi:dipeptidyl aminopeptidase/acylaminoacyl peptidase